MSSERFLVTGAMGCIGAWVVRNLAREGLNPVVFDLATDARRLKQIATPEEFARVRLVAGDITDLAAVEQALDEHEITHVIHLAALQVPFCRANPPLGARVNVVGTVNVFEAVAKRKARIERVVYASSIAVYDAADAADGMVQQTTVGHPTTLYGVYKQANEATARVYWLDQRVTSIGLRPYTVYGVGRDQGLTSAPTKAMFAAAVGQPYHIPFGGRSVYQYTADVAGAFIAAARAPFEGADIFNLPGSTVSMSEIVAAIEATVPEVHGQITVGAATLPFPEAVDAEPTRRALGALPVTPLHEAVAETVGRFRTLVARGDLAADALLS
ncbi:MAG: NAD(P)-dependent oxidoreductase [Roseiflexaceae bacterium]|nr:NAD(P)-dependent oxidoreductase [Roseiflexaceae bacterium]